MLAGSAFTKAKPKHGLLTVTRLAALRLFLLPFYYQWWICQTSSRIFIALLILYSLQLFNTFLYFSAWFPSDTFNTLEVRHHRNMCVPTRLSSDAEGWNWRVAGRRGKAVTAKIFKDRWIFVLVYPCRLMLWKGYAEMSWTSNVFITYV